MAQGLEILRELTESARVAGAIGTGRGRYERTPDFAAPAFKSSRPSSDRGTTFHFAHKTKSKTNDMSEGNFSQTTSAAHQGYIERPSATEETTADITRALRDLPAADLDPGILHEGFTYPARVVDDERISFGTLGTTKAARRAFWDQVETHEARRSRVQCRIIAELPAELDKFERAMIARDFCQNFEDRALPYWATLHAPSKKNDSRNYHLHITYFDRPAGRSGLGHWDFAMVEKTKTRCRHVIAKRPYRNGKHADTRDIKWPKRLRRSFADTSNFYLSIAGKEKRHDPRSYAESGILKEPTEHLGNKRSALETFGLETDAGVRNAKREIRWRIERAEAPWRERAYALRDADHLQSTEAKEHRDTLFSIASEGITSARRAASYDITSQLLTVRSGRRQDFIDGEVVRLTRKDDMMDISGRNQTVIALAAEASLYADRERRILSLAETCRAQGLRHDRRSRQLGTQFDKLFSDSDPSVLFAEDETSGFSPIESIIGDDTPAVDLPAGLEITDSDAQDISALISELERPDPTVLPSEEESSALRDVDRLRGPARINKPGETRSPDNPEIAASTTELRQDTGPDSGLRRRDPIEEIIAQVARDGVVDSNSSAARAMTAADFPGAMAIARTNDSAEVRRLDGRLRAMDNRTLRQMAIASRDATDLCPPSGLKDDMNRGWLVLRFEAERRGLDMDTGIHDAARATDPERANLHTDQDPCPIRVVRKNIARQRVRG